MRVIAGSAKRISLVTPQGMDTRPTTDRIKETLFNMLQSDLCEASFLDLFSGSGGIGIEALSRGADKCVFIEKDAKALSCIRENLKKTHLEGKAEIFSTDVFVALQSMEKQKHFDIVFMDPPYRMDYEKRVLAYLKDSSLIDENTLIIFEAALETDTKDIEALGFEIEKIKEYKTNKHVFLYRHA